MAQSNVDKLRDLMAADVAAEKDRVPRYDYKGSIPRYGYGECGQVPPTIGQPPSANSDEPVTPSEWAKANAEGLWTYEKYKTLSDILDAAFNHAATGKGKERHARDLPFDKQPMLETTRLVGPGFPLGQAIKKAGEAAGMIERGELDAAEAECLGAINYLAGAVAWMRERQKQTDKNIAAAA